MRFNYTWQLVRRRTAALRKRTGACVEEKAFYLKIFIWLGLFSFFGGVFFLVSPSLKDTGKANKKNVAFVFTPNPTTTHSGTGDAI